MADRIVNFKFDNSFDTSSATPGSLSGDITVNFTTRSVTGSVTGVATNTGGASPGAPIQFTFPDSYMNLGGDEASYNVFAMANFGVSGYANFSLRFAGTEPTSFSSMSYTYMMPTAVVASTGSSTPQPVTTTLISDGPVCYVAGTLIRTGDGDVPIEALQVGDLVATGSGRLRPVTWIGRQSIRPRSLAQPRLTWPVRITAHALGDGQPSRDLLVSRNHSVCITCVEDVMVPAYLLINGATIRVEAVDQVEYWHLELETHDVIFANDLRSESYLEWGNRSFFAHAAGKGSPGRSTSYDDFCLPVVLDGPELDLIRRKLWSRAERLGYRSILQPRLRLMVDGEVQEPLDEAGSPTFSFPSSATEVRILSDTFVPDDVGAPGDFRRLGVSVSDIRIEHENGEARSIAIEDERLDRGFERLEVCEAGRWRWTDGDALLPASAWIGLTGEVRLTLDLLWQPTRHWTGPDGRPVAAAGSPPCRLTLVASNPTLGQITRQTTERLVG